MASNQQFIQNLIGQGIWKDNNADIEELLEDENWTIEQLLNHEQTSFTLECGNTRLQEFLQQNLSTLIEYITILPEDPSDLYRGYKFPYVTCELLATEQLLIEILQEKQYMQQIVNFWLQEEKLNTVLAGYVLRITNALLTEDREVFMKFIFEQSSIIEYLIRHLDNQSAADLILQLIVNPQAESTMSNTYLEVRLDLMDLLVEALPYSSDSDALNISYIIAEINRLINTASDGVALVKKMQSENWVSKIFEVLCGEDSVISQTAIKILTILMKQPILDESCGLVRQILNEIGTIADLLDPLEANFRTYQFGDPVAWFGVQGVLLVEFILAVLKQGMKTLDQAVSSSGALCIITRSFFSYQWNSSLHAAYYNIVDTILTGYSIDLLPNLLISSELPEQLIQAALDSQVSNVRPGNMGYITKIANSLVIRCAAAEDLSTVLEQVPGWDEFENGILYVRNEIENTPLCGFDPRWPDDIDAMYEEETSRIDDLLSSYFNDKDDKTEEPAEESNLFRANDILQMTSEQEADEYNSNQFWSVDLINIEDLPEL